jgi:hypothetical protein
MLSFFDSFFSFYFVNGYVDNPIFFNSVYQMAIKNHDAGV